MSYYQAVAILNRIQEGCKKSTFAQITKALELTGDIDA
jgi:hypothetical protein